MSYNIDQELNNADWLKTQSWDLPTDPALFLETIGRNNLSHFLTLPAAQAMPAELRAGLAGISLVEPATPSAKGGTGSGNFGHEGRPGLVGGSASSTMRRMAAKYPEVASRYSQHSGTEMGSIGSHTADVFAVWPTQISQTELASISKNWGSDVGKLMEDAIALHDIGKPDALAIGDKRQQHHFTTAIMQSVLSQEGHSEKDIKLATELFNHDLIGEFVRGFGMTAEEVAAEIRRKAKAVGMSLADFTKLQLAVYFSDAGAYPYVRNNFMQADSAGRLSMLTPKLEHMVSLISEKKGGEGSGHFHHAGRPGEVGGSAASGVSVVKQFTTDEEAYGWHEKGKVRAWAMGLSKEDRSALETYAGFGYADINNTLRGDPPTKLFTRPATPEEEQLVRSKPDGPDKFKPIDLGDGKTLRWKVFGGEVEWRGVNQERVKDVTETANRINDIIANRGVVLNEDMEVSRVAYLPGTSVEQLQESVDGAGKIEEKGFSSTFLGPAQGRATGDGYLSYGIGESKYKRYGSNDMYHDEVGTAIRFEIVLPAGTKVASIEAARRAFKYSSGETNLDDPKQRSESEVLLGSGARFRIDRLHINKPLNTGWTGNKDIPYVTLQLTYIGGGSSQP